MEDVDKRKVGEQIEPGGRPKAPGRLALLQRFLNTWNHEFPREYDRLGTPERAQAWLVQKRLLPRTAVATAEDAGRLRSLREALRAFAAAHTGAEVPPAAVSTLEREVRRLRFAIAVDASSGEVSVRAASAGVNGTVESLLAIVYESQLLGQWRRMKGCRRCGYAFYDRSKNRSAAWCAMSICGNRAKNQTYRRRSRRDGRPAHETPGVGT